MTGNSRKLLKLHQAVEKGDRSRVKQLLSKGAKVDELNPDGHTPLMLAAMNECQDIVADLIEGGADVNATGKHEETALHHAAFSDCPMAIAALIRAGSSVDQKDKNGDAPLHLAVRRECPAAVRALIKGGVDVDFAADADEDTPLHMAAWNGHRQILGMLIDAEADIQKTNQKGQKPLNYAQRGGHDDIADFFIEDATGAATATKGKSVGVDVFEGAAPSIVEIRTGRIQGSGVIVKPGIVATNYHVVRGGIIRVAYERETYRARIRDDVVEQDFCLLDVDGLKGRPVKKIRPYHTLSIGEDVYAIGNPKAQHRSLSVGVIAQLRRDGDVRQIQTDAAISPGSSGGGLFDMDGNLIGITTEIHGGENVQNINYAIPADLVLGYHFESSHREGE